MLFRDLEMKLIARRTLSQSFIRIGGYQGNSLHSKGKVTYNAHDVNHGDGVPPSWEQLMGSGNQYFYFHNHVTGWFPAAANTTYEAELARISKEMGWDAEAPQWGEGGHLTREERRYWRNNETMLWVWCGIIVALIIIMPDFLGNNNRQDRREAVLRIEEAAALGKSPISPDYAPAELMESMVPPAGDWEKIWLSRQPSTMVRGASKWCW
jgi:hypothetical protein